MTQIQLKKISNTLTTSNKILDGWATNPGKLPMPVTTLAICMIVRLS